VKLRLITVAFVLSVCIVPAALAQQQPAEAVNSQDEQINIAVPANTLPAGRLSILRSGDKLETNNYVSEVVELQNGIAYELLPHVIRAVTPEKGSTRVMKYTPPDGGRVRYFIQVVTTEAQMPSVIETIKALDLPDVKSSTGDARYAIRMKYRAASEVADVIANTYLSGEGKVFADDVTNTLYIQDSVSDSVGDLAYAEFYDVPAPQIDFEVQIIEVADADAGKLGLDWDAWKRSLGGQITSTRNWYENGDTFSRIDCLLTIDARTLAEFLNYTTQTGSATMKRRATISANNLTPAVLSMTKRIPYITYELLDTSQTGISSAFRVITEDNPQADAANDDYPSEGPRTLAVIPPKSWQKVDMGMDEEGIVISITPVIGTEMVTATIDLAANTITGVDGLDRPIVTEHDFETVVTLQDMQWLRIATLENVHESKYRRGIPGLKSIPGIRYLFSVEGTRYERTHTHILIRPCFCNWRVFEARQIGQVGDILRTGDSYVPPEVLNELLPSDIDEAAMEEVMTAP
jgi:hypothetical protein